MSETITTCFPQDIKAASYRGTVPEHSTAVLPLGDGASQRLPLFRPTGVTPIEWQTTYLSETDKARVQDFLNARRGAYEAFYFFLHNKTGIYSAAPAGTTDGTTNQQIVIPFRESVVSAVYVDGVAHAFSQVSAIGTFGEDAIVITGTALSPKAVTIDVVGRRRLGVRNVSDNPEPELLTNVAPTMWMFSLSFIEV